jgi:hypothetical protein
VRIAAALAEAQRRAVAIAERTSREDGRTDPSVPYNNSLFGLQLATEAIADALAADNPRFDRDRFARAAEGGAA